MNIGKTIRSARKKKNLNQTQISDKLGYTSPQFVSLMERNKTSVPYRSIKKICKLLDIPKYKLVNALVKNYKNKLLKEIR